MSATITANENDLFFFSNTDNKKKKKKITHEIRIYCIHARKQTYTSPYGSTGLKYSIRAEFQKQQTYYFKTFLKTVKHENASLTFMKKQTPECT